MTLAELYPKNFSICTSNSFEEAGQSKNFFLFFSIGSQVDAEHVLSRLWIGGASRQDSGNYTCHLPGHDASDFPRAKVKVLVVDGMPIFKRLTTYQVEV